MRDKTILLSSYNCNPFGVSESFTSFIWMTILLKQFKIILLTTDEAEESILKYYKNKLPANLTIIAFVNRFPFKEKRVMREGIKLGYFYFNQRIKKYLKKNPQIIDGIDIVFQKTPESFRYFTSLTGFNKPVYIGPLSGGLKPPASFKSYFKSEPFLHKLRNFDSMLLKLPVYKRQFRRIDKVLVCFDYLSDILPPEYLKNKKILLNSAIDCSNYKQAPMQNNAKPSVLYVGRLTKYKGPELLIRALGYIKKNDFILNIVGDGEERKYLEKLVKELHLENQVLFHGFKPSEEVKRFYYNASIFCFPSLTEAVGIVFYEAMASGLPIITIDNGGPRYICPPEGAIKIPISSPDEIIKRLNESIVFLLENPEIRQKMGQFNRNYSIEHYDWKILERDILQFFSDELDKHYISPKNTPS